MAARGTMRRPGRWDVPFSAEMTDGDVDRVLALAPFHSIDASLFPPNVALHDIVRNDARLEHCRRGLVIVREGDYGNSTFVVLSGTVGVVIDRAVGAALANRGRRRHLSIWSSLAQLWRQADVPERRDLSRYGGSALVGLAEDAEGDARPVVNDLDALLAKHSVVTIGEGEMFGEIAALSRTPRTASVIALSDCELLELRWQGLREIRRRDPAFRARIDHLYLTRSLKSHLAEAPLFEHLDESALAHIVGETQFETYGEFEWFSSFKRQIEGTDESHVIEQEPTIAGQGDYADGLVLVRAGFARISEKLGHGQRTVGYATTNDLFGLAEIVNHAERDEPLAYQYSLSAIGYVDILRVPTLLIEQYVLPRLGGARRAELVRSKIATDSLGQSLINFLVDRRIVNGTATMMINTERCVGCDDCVRACAAAHDSNPRFIRHGPEHGKFMIANACMHCQDPVCLIGCPTGAIHRLPDDGRVIINDATCIGCGTCANSCPYSNIRMVEIRNRDGAFIVDDATGAPIVKATKCDLCVDQLGGPACQRACPHDALVRIDMRDQAALADWIKR
ncbi:MAG: cyclic nucleotide-binding domain-containing protein [Alphaproteobacteria bacterium]